MVRSMPLIELVDRKSWRRLIMCAATALVWFAAHAAELDGVQLPDPVQVDGTWLHLNGFGLRTYSLLGIRHSAIVSVGGQQIGVISQPQFADAMLATFLGTEPASPKLKRELLQGHG